MVELKPSGVVSRSDADVAARTPARTPGGGTRADAKRCPVCAGSYPADFRVCPRDATLLEDAPPDQDPLIGCVLNDIYELLAMIGEGGMGCVYEARHARLRNKRFAVKVLHGDLLRQSDLVTRFEREAEAASAFTHEHVASVIDINRTPDGQPYIVSELLEGEQLGDYLVRAGKLSPAEAIRIAGQLCRALGAAHARGIVHRDMKPENVFLVGEGAARSVKVLDFGISKLGSESSTLTKTGMVMGTPAYMPPEQARGQHVDHRADIYAVGVILYRAVTGKLPFEGTDPVATLTAVIAHEPPRPCTLDAAIAPALELVIQTAMAKNPNERYASMQDLQAALVAIDPAAGVTASDGAASSAAPVVLGLADQATARTFLATPAEGNAVTRSRPSLVALSLAAALCVAAGLLDASNSAIRWLHGGAVLSNTELVLTAAGVLALLIAPSIAWVRFVAQRVWPNTPRTIEVVARLRRILVTGLVAYGAIALALRFLHSVAQGTPQGVDGPADSILAFTAAVSAAATAWLLDRIRRRR